MTHTPITDVLADVRELFGGAHASIWDATDTAAALRLLSFVSADSCAPELDDRATGLVAWAAQQKLGETCTDGESVTFAATPLPVANGRREVLAVGARDRTGLRLPREFWPCAMKHP